MCGIAGTYGFGSRQTLAAMTEAIAHRGPDDEGLFEDPPAFLGSRRLAIRDIAGGRQPMTNEDGTIVVIYNGEIYNEPELREDLLARGHVLRTHCDTELLPHLYEEYGVDFALRLNGIFAISLWDRRKRQLILYRDPIGVKPLLYAIQGRQLAFGSEAKAILKSGLVTPELNPNALHLSMNVRYIPGCQTLFQGIHRLEPGHCAVMSDSGLVIHSYTQLDWSPDETLSEAAWLEGIRDRLETAVHRQLVSDVPIGVSLSGGVDSSALVALIRRRYTGDLKTFTLGFGEPSDENADARYVAEQFETDHHDLILNQPALANLEDATRYAEEPKVNCLQLFLLHRYMRQHVTVALSGLGGDELFAGYDFYRYMTLGDRLERWIPAGTRQAAIDPTLTAAARIGAKLGAPQLDLLVRKLEWMASIGDGSRRYLLLRNAWDTNSTMLERVYDPAFLEMITARTQTFYTPYFDDTDDPAAANAIRAEFHTKMVNDLLHNEDSMSMANSVESRVPLLDLDFVRFAIRMPARLRFRHGLKGALKLALRNVLPREVLRKKKWGFTVNPVEQFRKDLKPLAGELLLDSKFLNRRIFRREFIESIVRAHPRRNLRWHYFMLIQMIAFEFWCRCFVDGER